MTYGIGRSRTRFVVLALLSLVLMGLDTYTDSLKQTRPIVGLIVVPVHLVAMIPALILARANSLPLDVARLQQDYQALEENRLLLNSRLQRLEAIEAEIENLKQGPMGMMVTIAGNDMLKVIIKQFMGGLVTRVAPVAEARLRAKTVDVPVLRGQVDRLLEEKLEELTPEIVKSMMERVIRDHLGWLIVWGNVFGAAIGLLARDIAVHWHL